jgi:hypothetical protein
MSDWDGPGYPTPEEAATREIPKRYFRVESVTYSNDGNSATVELVTNEEPVLHPLTVWCVRDEYGLWREDGSAG